MEEKSEKPNSCEIYTQKKMVKINMVTYDIHFKLFVILFSLRDLFFWVFFFWFWLATILLIRSFFTFRSWIRMFIRFLWRGLIRSTIFIIIILLFWLIFMIFTLVTLTTDRDVLLFLRCLSWTCFLVSTALALWFLAVAFSWFIVIRFITLIIILTFWITSIIWVWVLYFLLGLIWFFPFLRMFLFRFTNPWNWNEFRRSLGREVIW